MQRMDDKESEKWWKVAIAGAPGTGKTSLAVTAPRPLILLTERQGLPSVKQAARRLGVPVPPVLYVERMADYRLALRALRGDRSRPFVVVDDSDTTQAPVEVLRLDYWPETVVLDSLTDTCAICTREIREQAPPKPGRDGLPVDAQRFWGVLMDRMHNLIKLFRDLPMHVVFLCLRDERTKEDEDGNVIERIVQPKLTPRSMVGDLCAAVNVVGYSYRTRDVKKGGATVFGVVTDGGEQAITKPCEPLRRVEVADLSSWFARLNGALEAPAEPQAPAELGVVVVPEPAPMEPAPDPAAAAPQQPEAPKRSARERAPRSGGVS